MLNIQDKKYLQPCPLRGSVLSYQLEEVINLGMVMWSQIQIPDNFSTFLTIAEWRISGDLLAFLIQSLANFHDTLRND